MCDSWRPATTAEIVARTRAEQLDDETHRAVLGHEHITGAHRANCSAPFWHSCLGACRHGATLKADPMSNVSTLASLGLACAAGESAARTENAMNALYELLTTHVRPPRCTLSFVGDSLMHDTFTAAVIGALRLGFRLRACNFTAGRSQWHEREKIHHYCGAGRWVKANHNTIYGTAASHISHALLAAPEPESASEHGRADGDHTSHRRSPACSSVHLFYWSMGEKLSAWENKMHPTFPHSPVLYGASSVILLSFGTHANTPGELSKLWHKSAPSFLKLANAHAQRALNVSSRTSLLWLDVPPQHFEGFGGTGTYNLAAAFRRCVAVNASLASWRNALIHGWAAPWRAPGALTPNASHDGWVHVPTFDVFVHRHDLHGSFKPEELHQAGKRTQFDCTHYCFSPFLYEPVWALVVRALTRGW